MKWFADQLLPKGLNKKHIVGGISFLIILFYLLFRFIENYRPSNTEDNSSKIVGTQSSLSKIVGTQSSLMETLIVIQSTDPTENKEIRATQTFIVKQILELEETRSELEAVQSTLAEASVKTEVPSPTVTQSPYPFYTLYEYKLGPTPEGDLLQLVSITMENNSSENILLRAEGHQQVYYLTIPSESVRTFTILAGSIINNINYCGSNLKPSIPLNYKSRIIFHECN